MNSRVDIAFILGDTRFLVMVYMNAEFVLSAILSLMSEPVVYVPMPERKRLIRYTTSRSTAHSTKVPVLVPSIVRNVSNADLQAVSLSWSRLVSRLMNEFQSAITESLRLMYSAMPVMLLSIGRIIAQHRPTVTSVTISLYSSSLYVVAKLSMKT